MPRDPGASIWIHYALVSPLRSFRAMELTERVINLAGDLKLHSRAAT